MSVPVEQRFSDEHKKRAKSAGIQPGNTTNHQACITAGTLLAPPLLQSLTHYQGTGLQISAFAPRSSPVSVPWSCTANSVETSTLVAVASVPAAEYSSYALQYCQRDNATSVSGVHDGGHHTAAASAAATAAAVVTVAASAAVPPPAVWTASQYSGAAGSSGIAPLFDRCGARSCGGAGVDGGGGGRSGSGGDGGDGGGGKCDGCNGGDPGGGGGGGGGGRSGGDSSGGVECDCGSGGGLGSGGGRGGGIDLGGVSSGGVRLHAPALSQSALEQLEGASTLATLKQVSTALRPRPPGMAFAPSASLSLSSSSSLSSSHSSLSSASASSSSSSSSSAMCTVTAVSALSEEDGVLLMQPRSRAPHGISDEANEPPKPRKRPRVSGCGAPAMGGGRRCEQ